MMSGAWGIRLTAGLNKFMLCGNKPEETEFDAFWNSLIPFYRGRIEIVIAKL